MKTIGDLVEQHKAKNGGEITYTTKEIVTAIWETLNNHGTRITRNEAMNYILGILFTGLCIKIFVFS